MATKLVTRTYGNFKGVDFSNSKVSFYRSPDSINMWKNYESGDGIETRPGMTLLGSFDAKIYGLFFYRIQDTMQVIVHAGTKLYQWTNYPQNPVEKEILYENMNLRDSQSFVFNSVLFIKDGINYLEYNGEECKEVVGTVPITRTGTTPSGAIYKDDVDYVYQDVNCLSNLRKNGFVADGESTDYHLDTYELDPASIFIMEATINGEKKLESIDFTVDRKNGIVKFNEAPPKPLEDGDSNVIITYSKSNSEYKNRVLKSTILTEFDNRVFFSGNQDYPNTVFHSELDDPRYIRDNAYYTIGLDLAPVKALIAGNDKLWIFKETIQNYSSVYYMTPSIDYQTGKVYPSVKGNISTGCISTGVNFNDDICFFSAKGLEAIGNTIGNDQILAHRSSLIDSRLITNIDYKNVKLVEWRGYLMCLLDSKIFLADSRNMYERTSNNIEYEWFYWELPFKIDFITEYQNDLYLANGDGNVYILEGTTDNNEDIYSKWTTTQDTFGADSFRKITNKRGGTADVKVFHNDSIDLNTTTEIRRNNIGKYNDEKGYIVYRVKEKKFKWIQLEFSSNKPFGLFSCTLEAYIGGYVKR